MEHFTTDNQGWLALIVAEYERIRWSVRELWGLRPANLAVSDRMSVTLGHWDSQRRTITLSGELLQGSRWHLLVQVLKHELAHQVTAEIYGRPESNHDEWFGRACALLGIEARARIDAASLVGEEETQSRIHRTIRKLLALGTSPNRHEAESALRKAQYLALKYNIDMLERVDRPRYEFRLVGQPMKRVPSYTWTVARIVCDHYFVQYICRGYDDTQQLLDGGRYQVIELYGTPDNLDLAEYVWHYLLHQGQIEWVAYRQAQGLRNNRQKLSFLIGLYGGFLQTLQRRGGELAHERALVWRGDPGLRAFYRERNPHVKTVGRGGAAIDGEALTAGEDAGSRMQIRPGLKGGKEGGVRGLLT